MQRTRRVLVPVVALFAGFVLAGCDIATQQTKNALPTAKAWSFGVKP